MNEMNEIINKMINYRMPLYHDRLPINLLWSEKSGCTSWTKWFFFQNGLLEKALDHHPFIHVYRSVFCNTPEYKKGMVSALQTKPNIKLIRNPYSRAVSSFLHIIKYGTPKAQHNLNFYKSIQNIKLRNKCEGVSFKQFLYCLQKSGVRPEQVDGHVAQQYITEEEKLVTKYIKLEDYKKEVFQIERVYGMRQSPIEELIQSPHHQSGVMNTKSEVSHYENVILTREQLKLKQISSPIYKQFYDKETFHLCTQLFKEDIEMYKYKKIH